MGSSRRIVQDLARRAAIDPAVAIERLAAAGVRVRRVTDHVSPNQLHLAEAALGLITFRPKRQPKPGSVAEPVRVDPSARENANASASELVTIAKAQKARTRQLRTTAPTASFLTEDHVLRIHQVLVDFFAKAGDPIVPSGARDMNLLGSALFRPQTSIGDREKYRTLPQKAAALFHSLIKNHPFHNGNKRTALVATLAFLDSNGLRVRGEVGDDEIFNFVIKVATQTSGDGVAASPDAVVEEIAAWWRERVAPHDPSPSDMSINEFLSACKAAGCRVIDRGGSYLIRGASGKSISISGGVRKLAGGVVKNYAGVLGLAGPSVGTRLDEFQEGHAAEKHLVSRFMAVLRRLAHA